MGPLPCSSQSQYASSLPPYTGVYYNYTGQAGGCNNVNASGNDNLGAAGWDYQACTEMVMPISYNGTSGTKLLFLLMAFADCFIVLFFLSVTVSSYSFESHIFISISPYHADMFLPSVFSLSAQTQYCQAAYNTVPRPLWVPTLYAANVSQLAAGSNIFWYDHIIRTIVYTYAERDV